MRRAGLFVFLLALVLSCTRETPEPPPPPSPSPSATTTRDGGRLVRRLEGDVRTLNYLLQSTEDEWQVLSMVYDPLIALDSNLQPIPATAARWQLLEGGLAYVLHIDPRATFSDGTPVKASDVVFTLGKILDEESTQFASRFETLDREKTHAINERAVHLAFKEPRAGQLLAFNIGVMPEHVYAKENFAKTNKVVGNGPYVLSRRGRDGSILLERRKDYWREKPSVASILFRPISDDAVAWKALQRGDLDVARVNNDVWSRVKDDAAVKRDLEFHDVYQLAYNCIVWNLTDPILSDIRVRRALAMTFDRKTVIESIYEGQARPVTGPFTADQWAGNPAVAPIEFNPGGAAALLASAGWRDSDGDKVLDRDGRKFELTLLIPAGNVTSRAQSQVFQDALKAIGVSLVVSALDDSAFYDLVLKRNYQAAYISWVNDPDPDPFGLFHSTQFAPDGMNVVGYANPEADALMEQARSELDHQHRTELYHQLHEILARDQPYLWTVQVAEKWAVNRRVKNVQVARGAGLFGWYPGPRAWWLAQ